MSRFYARVQRYRALTQPTTPLPRIDARAPALDHQRARLIPIIGKMAGGGAQPGSRPDTSKITRR